MSGHVVDDLNVSSFLWPPLESNPQIFEGYMAQMGLLSRRWGFSELLGFDDELLGLIPTPVVAVIVNFEPQNPKREYERGSDDAYDVVDYYMKQTPTLDNACGLIACLHAIYNHPGVKGTLGPDSILARFYEQVKDQNPPERATSLENCTEIQQRHQAFSTCGLSNMPATQGDVKHHYVAFVVNSKQQLVELSGTRKGPNIVAENCEDVLRGSVKTMQRRLAEGEITQSLSMMGLHAKS